MTVCSSFRRLRQDTSALLIAFVAIIGCDGSVVPVEPGSSLWAQRAGGSSDDYGHGIVVDREGNVIVVGEFAETIDLGGGPLDSDGAADIFLAKFLGTSGDHIWSRRVGGAGTDVGMAVAVDHEDNVTLTGAFEGTVDFGDGPMTSNGASDVFLAKYSGDGDAIWSLSLGGNGSDLGRSVGIDAAGNILVTGVLDRNVLLARFSSDGEQLWLKRLGNTGDDAGFGLSVGKDGQVVVVGGFEDTVSFGGDPLISADAKDVFVAKYSASGAHLWSQRFGGTGEDLASSVAGDDSRGIVFTGHAAEGLDFGGGPLDVDDCYPPRYMFVVKLGEAGAYQWSERLSGCLLGEGRAVAVDPMSNVIMTGGVRLYGAIGTSFPQGFFVVKNAGDGANAWGRLFACDGFVCPFSGLGRSVATDVDGNVFLTGNFTAELDLGSSTLQSAGGNDVFVVKFER